MTSHSQPSTTATSQHTPNKILAIPELSQRIAHSLDSKTIVACARVNKAWHSIWLPIIWHTIDAGMHWRNQGFLSALHQHADLIRNLKCARYDDIRLLFDSSASSSPTLESSLSDQTSSGPKGGLSTEAKEQVLCKNLITLVLPKTTLINQADQARLLRLNSHLLDLSLTLHDDPPPNTPTWSRLYVISLCSDASHSTKTRHSRQRPWRHY